MKLENGSNNLTKYQKGWTTYNPNSKETYALSRSKIDLFMECPKCFYLDRRKWVKRPDYPPYRLNSLVDDLLKKEFDLLREKGQSHELMKQYGINAVPFQHQKIDQWRHNFTGARVLHKPTNLTIYGSVDDLWVTPDKQLIIVDYKAITTDKEFSLEDQYKQGYKKQVEIYQWIFRQLGFKVFDTAYFIFANAERNRPKFDGRLEFVSTILAHKGDDSWVEPTIIKMKRCLDSNKTPPSNPNCKYCNYTYSYNKSL